MSGARALIIFSLKLEISKAFLLFSSLLFYNKIRNKIRNKIMTKIPSDMNLLFFNVKFYCKLANITHGEIVTFEE